MSVQNGQNESKKRCRYFMLTNLQWWDCQGLVMIISQVLQSQVTCSRVLPVLR